MVPMVTAFGVAQLMTALDAEPETLPVMAAPEWRHCRQREQSERC